MQLASARLALGSSLTLVPTVGSETYKAKLESAYAAAQSAGDTAGADAAKQKLDAYNAAVASPGSVTITAQPVTDLGTATSAAPQKHLVNLIVTVTKPESFIDENGNFAAPSLELLGYDSRYYQNHPVDANATADDEAHLKRYLDFTNNEGTAFLAPADLSATRGGPAIVDPYDSRTPPYDGFDYLKLDKDCEDLSGRATGQSFGAAAWNIDFSNTARSVRHSWNFAGENGHQAELLPGKCGDPQPDTKPEDLTANDNSSNPLPTYAQCNDLYLTPVFKVRSIVQKCIIDGNTPLVTGFYNCETLEIQGRSPTKPLTIVGTIIVKYLDIDPSAVKAGITWYSIYHPDATSILRNPSAYFPNSSIKAILRPTTDPNQLCTDGLTSLPIWAQHSMSVPHLQDLYTCNVVSLRFKGQNFRWTAVDPDCGTPPGLSNTICKNHPLNFFVMEQARGGGP
jgi:hypothetical protein